MPDPRCDLAICKKERLATRYRPRTAALDRNFVASMSLRGADSYFGIKRRFTRGDSKYFLDPVLRVLQLGAMTIEISRASE